MSFSADLQATANNFETLLEGKSTFTAFATEEGDLVKAEIAKLPAIIGGVATAAWDSLEAGASTLVGAGLTVIGPILNETSDQQATQLMDLMQLAGIPATGPFSGAEHAALTTFINGMKANLDRIGLHLTLVRGVSVGSTPQPAPAPAPVPAQPPASAPQ